MVSQLCLNSVKCYSGFKGNFWISGPRLQTRRTAWGCNRVPAEIKRDISSTGLRTDDFSLIGCSTQGKCLPKAISPVCLLESNSGAVHENSPPVTKQELNETVYSHSEEPQQMELFGLKQGGTFLLGAVMIDAGLLSGAVQLGTLSQDVAATVLALGGAFIWVRLFDELSRRDLLEQKLSRKLVHITAGLLFLFTWPFFSGGPSARFFASVPSLTNMLRLLSLGLGISKNEGVVKSVSREGNPRELLRGPLYYVIVLAFVTVVFWRESPVGITALGMMCAGDGIADIVGRRFGKWKLPYNRSKSWAGSIAMFVFGSLVSLGVVYLYCSLGYFSCDVVDTTWRIATIALAATVVESLPITDKLDDNFTVPLTAIAIGSLLFPGSMLALNAI